MQLFTLHVLLQKVELASVLQPSDASNMLVGSMNYKIAARRNSSHEIMEMELEHQIVLQNSVYTVSSFACCTTDN